MARFALPKETDPRREQPPGNKAADDHKERFPNNHRERTIGDRTAHNRICRCEKEEMDPANEQEPAETAEIVPNEFTVRSNRFA